METHDPHSPESSDTGPGQLQRRKFLSWGLGTAFFAWFGTVAYPVARYLFPPEGPTNKESSVKVGKVDDFKKNSGTLFRIGNKPGILLRNKAGEFRAFIAICTHLDCTVQFKDDEEIVWCACHNGKYNMNGINIAGPPPRPLTPLEVAIKGDEVHVSFTT